MFCDLADSTRLAGQLDPEDLREVIRAYQETCVEALVRLEGYVARYMGDGVLVYFGYPQAHDDDAQRAVRAGLAIVAALPALKVSLQSRLACLQTHPLRVRIGIRTGLVVIEEIGRPAVDSHG
jgi:class 3 adenylate cyclase